MPATDEKRITSREARTERSIASHTFNARRATERVHAAVFRKMLDGRDPSQRVLDMAYETQQLLNRARQTQLPVETLALILAVHGPDDRVARATPSARAG